MFSIPMVFLLSTPFSKVMNLQSTNALIQSEATEPGRGQASVLICASPWIDSLAHTIQDVIPRYKGHNYITLNDPEIKIV
jgi:hypothetical protein